MMNVIDVNVAVHLMDLVDERSVTLLGSERGAIAGMAEIETIVKVVPNPAALIVVKRASRRRGPQPAVAGHKKVRHALLHGRPLTLEVLENHRRRNIRTRDLSQRGKRRAEED